LDVEVVLSDGAFPLVAVAVAEGKTGQTLTVVRTGTGQTLPGTARPVELQRQVLLGTDLGATDSARLPARAADRSHTLALGVGVGVGVGVGSYRWTINGKTLKDSTPLPVGAGERVRLRFANHTMMFHPMHLHGHIFAIAGGGPRNDTVIVRPMQQVDVEFDADNPGQWVAHCDNIHHAETGMMVTMSSASWPLSARANGSCRRSAGGSANQPASRRSCTSACTS